MMDAVRNDVVSNVAYGDLSRRIFVAPRVQVHGLNMTGNAVTSLDMTVDGVRQPLPIASGCAVVLANGTIEATRLALKSLGVGSTQLGAPRVDNLMAHLRSNITVRIKRAALGLGAPVDLEMAALLIRGTALGRRFHFQVTAADVADSNPEANMWSMVPDICAGQASREPGHELGLHHIPRDWRDGKPTRRQQHRSRAQLGGSEPGNRSVGQAARLREPGRNGECPAALDPDG